MGTRGCGQCYYHGRTPLIFCAPLLENQRGTAQTGELFIDARCREPGYLIKRNGSALLSALFLMTLIAIAATAMSTRLQLDIYRTRLSFHSAQLNLASEVVGFWAMDRLMNPSVKLTRLDEEGR